MIRARFNIKGHEFELDGLEIDRLERDLVNMIEGFGDKFTYVTEVETEADGVECHHGHFRELGA